MTLQALILVALGLSMDAFGASISRGAALDRIPRSMAFRIAGLFGLFAVAAPVIGWAVGAAFYDLISALDHWIAFVLLSAIGIKMIVDAVRDDGMGNDGPLDVTQIRLVIVLGAAIATNVDAAVVGVALPGLRVELPAAAGIIGFTTFGASFIGLYLGRLTGAAFGHRAEIAGGLILIAIGTRILIEHTLMHDPAGATALQFPIFG